MIKPQKKITNPMTIIAIFAVLSESSAAVSLPFLEQEEKELYVWFLISFPFYLLLLFFATLNFNYRSLYAPSDFEKGKHFMKAMVDTEHSEKTSAKGSNHQSIPNTSSGGQCVRSPDLAPASRPRVGLQTLFSVQHHIQLPEHVKDLYIIDARYANRKNELCALLENVQNSQENLTSMVLFITCNEPEALLKAVALKHSRQAKKRNATFYVAYDLSSHGLTIMDQEGPQAHGSKP
ncbi:hypothetical protein [Pseudomonas sp. C32]|jgi:hypothetical protein|uniref:hypothetical protein n=1 Tax=Pseudomonas sp. C32 TaxID=1529208 RepID=UPI002617E344|nr:hypothetical protein [Pseudomonas sp. C32]MDN4547395.1 hypothetical protein [Pseudomonas sp. C32]